MLRLTRRGLETGYSGTAPVLDPTSEGPGVKSPRSTQPYIRLSQGFIYLVVIMGTHEIPGNSCRYLCGQSGVPTRTAAHPGGERLFTH